MCDSQTSDLERKDLGGTQRHKDGNSSYKHRCSLSGGECSVRKESKNRVEYRDLMGEKVKQGSPRKLQRSGQKLEEKTDVLL